MGTKGYYEKVVHNGTERPLCKHRFDRLEGMIRALAALLLLVLGFTMASFVLLIQVAERQRSAAPAAIVTAPEKP